VYRQVKLLLRKFSTPASLPLLTYPHMLRHACGFALADQGADTRLIQDYLGHRNIQHTVKYTATNPARFEKLWRLPRQYSSIDQCRNLNDRSAIPEETRFVSGNPG
jgi:site-specific recombinase XerD